MEDENGPSRTISTGLRPWLARRWRRPATGHKGNGGSDVPRAKKRPNPGEQSIMPAKGAPTTAFLERALGGDKSCREELDALMDDPEWGALVVEFFGDLPGRVELRFVENMTGDNLAGKAGILRKMGKLRSELAGPKTSSIERLLAERAA
ncbi:MAG: hypothetical protein WKF75_16035 [Singulisphaera sp.]